jgi:23S rRNA (cytidine1920-2'-O)/16S rRNA (cytidine1409-2'-O)-methyltransferase
MRLDKYLIQNGYFDSRNKAGEAIKNEKVRINSEIIIKASYKVNEDDKIEVLGENFVSRAAWKLKNYIDKYNINTQNKLALDIGSSTGGFSEVLLLNGVKKVVCVDVGKNQLHSKIRDNEKSEVYEETDIREFQYPQKFDIIVSDVSFISLLKIIYKIYELAKEDIILLFKPQFEVGRSTKRDKRGVVTDERAIFSALENFKLQCEILGWELIKEEESSILGKEGNKEYILHFKKRIINND